jgi:hypothetical protein
MLASAALVSFNPLLAGASSTRLLRTTSWLPLSRRRTLTDLLAYAALACSFHLSAFTPITMSHRPRAISAT